MRKPIFTEQDCIDAVRFFIETSGSTRIEEYNQSGMKPTSQTICRIIGWSKAVQRAGAIPLRPKLDDQLIVEMFKTQIATLGYIPTSGEYHMKNLSPSYGALRNHGYDWKNIILKIGLPYTKRSRIPTGSKLCRMCGSLYTIDFSDQHYCSTACRWQFDQWKNKALGLTVSVDNLNEKVKKTIQCLEEYVRKVGYWPSISMWNEYAEANDLYTHMALQFHTKMNWETLRAALNIPSRIKKFSEENCIAALKAAEKVLGPSFNRKQYNNWQKEKPEYPTAAQISLRCTGFNKGKEKAGLVANKLFGGKTFSDEELRAAIEECKNSVGELFSEERYELWRNGREEVPHIETIRKRLGGVYNAKKNIKLPAFPPGGRELYSEGRWKTSFMEFLSFALNHDRYEKWAKDTGSPSMKAISDNAGGYENALIEMLPVFIDKLTRKRRDPR